MRAITYIAGMLAIACSLAGCNPDPTPHLQPVTIGASDFCEVMKIVSPPAGKPTWSIRDTPKTIHGNRRIAAAVDARCSTPKPKS